MQVYTINDDALKSKVGATSPGPLGPELLSQWGAMHGEPLDVISWADGNFTLVADALDGLPKAVGSLYGCEAIYGREVVSPSVAIGYLPSWQISEVLSALPEPDFDAAAPKVIAAREELEGWLRRASIQSKGILVVWD